MKAVRTKSIITSLRAKKDGSLGLSVSTPELTSQEKVAFMELQGVNVDVWIKPLDEPPKEIIKINKQIGEKSVSSRLRSIIFVFWKKYVSDGDFEAYYRKAIERHIDLWKEKIDENK